MSRKCSSHTQAFTQLARTTKKSIPTRSTMFATVLRTPFRCPVASDSVCECLGMCPCPCAFEPVTRIRPPTRAQYAMSDPSAPECGDRSIGDQGDLNMRLWTRADLLSRPYAQVAVLPPVPVAVPHPARTRKMGS